MVDLLENEKIEDLQVGNLGIIQNSKGYRFTTDAVLLANFIQNAKNKNVVELGAGSGIISILIAYKGKAKSVTAIELQPSLANMANRSVLLNNMQDVISVINTNIIGCDKIVGNNFDIVVCNPPYIKVGCGQTQLDEENLICRHEVKITLQEIFENANKLLKNKGEFYLVHQASRFAEICALAEKYKMQVKFIQPVRSHEQDSPYLVLVKAVKQGNVGLTWLQDLVIIDKDGNITTTVKQLYGEKDE